MKSEKTYLEMVDELMETVNNDNIPENEKEEIKESIANLYDLLWKYSA